MPDHGLFAYEIDKLPEHRVEDRGAGNITIADAMHRRGRSRDWLVRVDKAAEGLVLPHRPASDHDCRDLDNPGRPGLDRRRFRIENDSVHREEGGMAKDVPHGQAYASSARRACAAAE